MCKRLLVLALVAMSSPAVLGSSVVVDDHFDDGAIGTNTTGIGTGFNTVGLTGGSVTESNSFAHLINTTNGAARAAIASKDGIALGAGIARFEFRGVSFARNTGNTGTGTTGRTAVGVRGNSTAEDVDTAVANGFWIQFESGDIGETNASWSGTSTLFYESSAHVKTVLATWRFNTLNWDDNNAATMNFTPVLDVILDLSPTGYSLTIKGDTIGSVTGSISSTYAAAGITNELTTGYAFAFNQGEAPGLDMSIDRIVISVPSFELASVPSPANGATDVASDVVLSWTRGQYAATHNIYLGTSFADVNAATASSPLLVSPSQDANSYDPPGRLAFATTYYWRVDEVNAPPSTAIFRGDVWNFTTEPYAYPVRNITATASATASTSNPQRTVDGSGLVGDLHGTDSTTMWSSGNNPAQPVWLRYDFDRVYKLYQMLVWNYNLDFETALRFGIKDTTIEYSTDGTTWATLGDFTFAQGASAPDYAPNTTVDFGGKAVKSVKITAKSNYGGKQYGLSELRFLYIPVLAREPQPATGSTGIDPAVTLSWRSGREAATANVYVGTDPNVLTLSGTATTNSFAPAGLSLGTQYYWRVDEVNTAATPSTWAGDVWNFATPDFLVVDDMESYDAANNQIFNVWVDGYGTTTNGSQVGYGTSANGTFGETTVIHGGRQSMPFRYGQNSATTSEATRTFAPARDWTRAGITTLVLFFYGDPANTTGQLYIKINGTKIVYSGDAGNIQRRRWNQWNIDLSTVAAATLKGVSSLVIGASNGKGILFIDDVRLYRIAPAIPTPVDPGTTGLIAYYAMNNSVQDGSGNGNNGTLVGAPTYAAGLSASNMALKLNGTTDCVDLGKKAAFNPAGSFSVALWANIGAWGTAWGHVMVSNRGETDSGVANGWQIRRGSSTGVCWTTRGIGGTDDLTGATPPQNEWIHIVCVYDQAAATKTLYINGLMSISGATTAGAKMTATTTDAYIGARSNAGNTGQESFFTGMLDEIRIYNRALTAGEADFLSKPLP